MSGKAAKIRLTESMHRILQQIASSRTFGKSIVARAEMVLCGFRKATNQQIAVELSCSAETVGLWRRRWRDSFSALLAMQFRETEAAFRRTIVECLSDAPRSGSPGNFSAAQIVELIAIACEPPELSGRPVTTWTGKELADEVKKRGVVESISAANVNRILREVDLQPHRSQYWCNTTEKDPEVFQHQVETVCQTYLEAPGLHRDCGTHTVCVDEMTGLQANERHAETKPSRPGQIAKEEFNYERHGTVCVTANWDVVAGQLIAPTIAETRDNCDFAKHIRQTLAIDPTAGWVFVMDNLNIHCGEPVVRLVADQLGIDQATLGKPKRTGPLKTMATRRDFLADPAHRIRFVYLPKHSSWLNQIEIVFGIINRRVIRRGSFTSKCDLVAKLHQFINYFNQTIAQPLDWTYTGRPTHTTPTTRPRTWRENRRSAKSTEKYALVWMNL